MRPRPRWVGAITLVPVILAACHDTPPVTVARSAAVTMAALSDVDQTATSGAAVAEPPSVRLADAYDNPVAGVDVSFVASAGGSVTGSPAITDANGVATLGNWTLGTFIGTSRERVQTVTATAGTLGHTFTGRAVAGPAASVTLTPATATIDGGRSLQYNAVVLDAYGNSLWTKPLIQWQSTNQAVATVAPFQSQATDFFPIATTTATAQLVPADGVATIRAQVSGSSPAIFATATLNASSLAPVAKDDQFATVQQCASVFCLTSVAALTGNVMSDNGSGADDRGQPLGTVVRFGGGDLGGNASAYGAGQTIATAKGDVSVSPGGTLSYERTGSPTDAFTVTFSYLMQNSSGLSEATVTIHVGPVGAGARVSTARTSATSQKTIDPRD